jgi:hypothetical protein
MRQRQPAATTEKVLKKINKRRETTNNGDPPLFVCAKFCLRIFSMDPACGVFLKKILTRVNDESKGLF